MYHGHVTFGDDELINVERLQAYVDHGVVPPGVSVSACEECDGLAEAIDPELSPYRTPLMDVAPWVDLEDPDTFDFTGLLPLDITGLDGTTATVAVTETLDGRAVAGRRNRAARQIGVTALLTGRTTEGVNAGLRWLTTLLHRTCIDGDDCATGAAVELFTVCPTPIYPTPNLDGELVTEDIPGWVEPDGGWTAVNGEYTEFAYDPPDIAGLFTPGVSPGIDGGDPEETVDPPLDGGTVEGDWDSPEVYDGGDPGPFIGEGTGYAWRDPQLGPICGSVTLQFCLSTPDEDAPDANITLLLIDPTTGAIMEEGPQVTIGFGGNPDTESGCTAWTLGAGLDYDQWAVGFATDQPVVVVVVQVVHFPLLSPEACIEPYRRIMPEATVTSGPTVTDQLVLTDCATWMKVEWVWTLGSPYKYGTTRRLATRVGRDFEPEFLEVGVTSTRYGIITPGTNSAPWNCAPPSELTSCATDPCAPGWVAPPAPPVVPDPTFAMIGGAIGISGTTVCIDPSVTAPGESALTITLATDAEPKVGVRVRIYDAVQNDCIQDDLCSWLAEYNIDYIPADGIVTIDGVTGTITTLCPDFAEPQPTPVRGDYGGPIRQPIVCGDRRLLIETQWMFRYPRGCDGVYVDNLAEGNLFTSIDISARED